MVTVSALKLVTQSNAVIFISMMFKHSKDDIVLFLCFVLLKRHEVRLISICPALLYKQYHMKGSAVSLKIRTAVIWSQEQDCITYIYDSNRYE